MSLKHDGLLYLSQEVVKQLCEEELDVVAIMSEVFRLHGLGETILPPEAYLAWTNENGEAARSLALPAFVGGNFRMAGTKIINGNPANPARGFPRASGLTLLYDPSSGRPLCVMEGAYLSSQRTAGVTALAVELLQGQFIECAAVIGAGVLAKAHIQLLVKRLPQLRDIWLFDVDGARAQMLRQELSPTLQKLDVTLQVASSAEEGIRLSQLVIPVTTTKTGYIPFSWLSPGSIVAHVSLDDILPDVVFQADRVFVDDWKLVSSDSHRLLGRMYQAGQVLGPDDPETFNICRRIDGELGELVLGQKPGRQHEDEILVFNPFGTGITDVALAARVYKMAVELKRGTWLPR